MSEDRRDRARRGSVAGNDHRDSALHPDEPIRHADAREGVSTLSTAQEATLAGESTRTAEPHPAEPHPAEPHPAEPHPHDRFDQELPDAEPVAEGASLWGDAWKELRRNPIFVISAVVIAIFIVMAAFPQLFTSANPNACNLSNSLDRPSAEHWFGFDLQGCDYYARTIYGARVSVSIGITVVAAAVAIAVIFGSLAGYYGGWFDAVVARISDIWFAIPTILGGIVILSVFGNRGFFQVAFVLIVLSWPTMLRLMRSSVLSAKEEDYVDAARALGAKDSRIIFKHILPNALAPVIVYATILVGVIISAEATLSFLGIGLQLPAISWGLMISTAQTRILSAPHLLFFPGVFLAVTVFGFILMGDALRDALDPKLR